MCLAWSIKNSQDTYIVIQGLLGWEENGRGKKVRGKKTGGKENMEENIIPPAAWMEGGKQGGKKMGIYQND